MTSRVRMSRCRRRSLALAAVTAMVGVPLLLGGPTASAADADTVTFSGGCGLLGSGLGASSSPDTERVNLPAGSGLRFANQLGRAATLRLDGEEAADVAAGGSADIIFHEGPVLATMQIDCLLGESAGAVTVEVAPAPQASQPEPSSGSGGTTPSGGSSSPGSDVRTGSSGSSGSGSSTQPGAPAHQSPDGSWWPGASAPGVPPAAGAEERPAPEQPGQPPTGPADGLSPRWGLATEPSHGGETAGDPDTVDSPAAGAEFADEELARTSGSVPGDGPVGLLALVATVCVVGVSAGAIRALISQRASRAAVR